MGEGSVQEQDLRFWGLFRGSISLHVGVATLFRTWGLRFKGLGFGFEDLGFAV